MKKESSLKTLIDILFFIQAFVLIGLIALPSSNLKLDNEHSLALNGLSYTYCILFIIHTISCLLFIKGLYHLRKVAQLLISKSYYTNSTILNIKQSGKLFIFVGLANITSSAITTIYKLFMGKLSISFDSIPLTSLFLIIIGLFFIIQSNFLSQAKEIKEENELTI